MSRDDTLRVVLRARRKHHAGVRMTVTQRSLLAGLTLAGVSSGARAQAPMLIETTVTEVVAQPFGAAAPGSAAIGFDGRFAAPPLRLKRGVPVTIALRNDLNRPFAPFLHGLRGASAFAGVPGLTRPSVLAPSAVETVSFTPREAGTFLLRPFGDDALQRAGLVRVVIVEEIEPVDTDLDIVLLLHDIPPGAAVLADVDAERDPLVNGAWPPALVQAPEGSRLRLRIVNGSTRDRDNIGIRNGVIPHGSPRAVEIARDATPLLDP
jgi:FtsP/CotA-like multicopper oxidase with cupredoxin domain